MQRQTLLVSIAVFALLASAIWLFAARAPAPAATPSARTAISPASNAVAPIPQVASAEPATTAAVATAAPASVAPATATAPPPAATGPSSTAAADASADEPAVPGADDDEATDDPSGAAPLAAEVPAPDKVDGGGTPAPADGHEAPAAAPDAPKDDRAVDLFADRIAALEDAHDGDAPDARAAAAQRAYEERDEGGDAAKASQASVRDAFAGWLAGLQPGGGHPSLIAVDCRSGACRVLIAQGGVDVGSAAQLERESPVNAFTRALAEFAQSAVWRDAHFEMLDNQMAPAGATATHPNDIALWTIYLRVPGADGPG